MRFYILALVLTCGGCGGSENDDIVGPFTGKTYRFVVDQLTLPSDHTQFADDLTGAGHAANQLGVVVATLAQDNDLTSATRDMLASGALRPVLEITTDDPALHNDATVGVRFIGRDGEPAGVMGAQLVDGVLTSNRDRGTHHPANGTVHLPLFADADPLTLPAIGLEITLSADATGFAGQLNGAFPTAGYEQPAYDGLMQLLQAQPTSFPILLPTLDVNRDGTVSYAEFSSDFIIGSILGPDVALTNAAGQWQPNPLATTRNALSFGLGLHVVACASGTCQPAEEHPCRDRVRDGGESDVDCGGACGGCIAGKACTADADCLSAHCDGGSCAAPTCSDGVQDGFELGVDCGWNCAPCANGNTCWSNQDCTSGNCAGTDGLVSSTGTCAAIVCQDGSSDNGETGVDCGGPCPPCAAGQPCISDSDCQDFGGCRDGVCS